MQKWLDLLHAFKIQDYFIISEKLKTTTLCALFLCFILTSSEYLGVMDRTPGSSVLCTGHRRNACGLQSFLSLIVLSLWSELLMRYCSILVKKKKERKKVHKKRCDLLGFYPILFLLKND